MSGRRAVVMLGADAASMRPWVLVPASPAQVQKRPLTEFFTPVRLGPADYDARQISSTIVFNDMAAGLGKYLTDSRQEANRVWASTSDTRFAGQITLPPKWTTLAVTGNPSATEGAAAFGYAAAAERFIMAFKDVAYYYAGGAWTAWRTLAAGSFAWRVRTLTYTGTGAGSAGEAVYILARTAAGVVTSEVTLDGGTTWAAVGGTIVDVVQDPIAPGLVMGMSSAGAIVTSDRATFAGGTNTTLGTIAPGGHFVGTMQGIVYALDGAGRLWSIDVTQLSGEVVRLVTESLPRATCGVVLQNAQIMLSDGRQVYAVHPVRPSRDLTPGLPDGVPASMHYEIRGLFAMGDRLFALVLMYNPTAAGAYSNTLYTSALWELRGPGWHVVTTVPTGVPFTDAGQRRWSDTGWGYDPYTRRMWLATTSTPLGRTIATYYNTLPLGGDNPWVAEQLVAGDGFEASSAFETGWHHFGLRGLKGPLLRVRGVAEWLSADHSVVVKYRLDGDEASAWTTLGTLTSTTRELLFAGGAGVAFRSVRFRLELARGASALSPNAAFAVDFLKIPDPASGFTWLFDVAASARRQRRSEMTLWDDLIALAGQYTLPAARMPGDATHAFYKLQGPSMTAYVGPDGKLRGAFQVVANEVT